MNTLLILFFAIVIIYFIFKARRASVKQSAVHNSFLAKITLNQLDENEKQRIKDKTIDIMLCGGMIEEDYDAMSEIVKFSFMALAMDELNIKPAVRGEKWHYVNNPYIALQNANHQIKVVKHHLSKKCIIDFDF